MYRLFRSNSYVGNNGKVVGVDSSEALISQAQSNFRHLENLSFCCADILEYDTTLRFDVLM